MITNPTIEKKNQQTNKQTKQKNCDKLCFLFQMPFAKKKTPTWKNPQVVNNIQKLGEHTVG